MKEIFTSINQNLDEELELLKKEEKFLSILKKELYDNSITNRTNYNNNYCNNTQNYDFDNNNDLLNYKNEITEINESLEDLNFSDLDNKLNKIEINTNDSINLERNNIKSMKIFNFIEETISKVTSNLDNVNVNLNQNKITKRKSKLQYNEPIATSRNGINMQTPQKTQVSYVNNLNNNFNSTVNKKNLTLIDEKKINVTAKKKSNKNLNIAIAKNFMCKSTKK